MQGHARESPKLAKDRVKSASSRDVTSPKNALKSASKPKINKKDSSSSSSDDSTPRAVSSNTGKVVKTPTGEHRPPLQKTPHIQNSDLDSDSSADRLRKPSLQQTASKSLMSDQRPPSRKSNPIVKKESESESESDSSSSSYTSSPTSSKISKNSSIAGNKGIKSLTPNNLGYVVDRRPTSGSYRPTSGKPQQHSATPDKSKNEQADNQNTYNTLLNKKRDSTDNLSD